MSNTDLPFERLLAHTAWLRRLARSLLSDPAEADDIVQETWVAALEHSGTASDAGSPVRDERAWLGGVFRNVLRQARRTRTRAVRREEEVAKPEALPAADDVVEQADLQLRMFQAVVDLHEPYRSTLLMRYFQELSAEEIGRRLDVPASTVRNRHKRALELLRERFDREHGGDRRAWCLLMIPIAIPKATGVASTALAAAATTGAWTMSMQVLAVTVSIALVGWGTSTVYRGSAQPAGGSFPEALVAMFGGESAAAEGESGSSEARAALAPAAKPAAQEGQKQEREPVAVQPSTKQVLQGRVFDTEGQPVAGARVLCGWPPLPVGGEAQGRPDAGRGARETGVRASTEEARGRAGHRGGARAGTSP